MRLVLVWIGAVKFTAYEAAGIEPFVTNSPPMSWLYDLVVGGAPAGMRPGAENGH